ELCQASPHLVLHLHEQLELDQLHFASHFIEHFPLEALPPHPLLLLPCFLPLPFPLTFSTGEGVVVKLLLNNMKQVFLPHAQQPCQRHFISCFSTTSSLFHLCLGSFLIKGHFDLSIKE